MNRVFRSLRGGELVLAWIVALAAVIALVAVEEYWLGAVVVCVAVVGSIVQLRRGPSRVVTPSWEIALKTSRPHAPRLERVDPSRPLIAIAVGGERRGIYVSVIPAIRSSDWIYQAGPQAWERTPADGDEPIGADDRGKAELRFLPQGDLADEIWRRDFDSVWRVRRYRALAKPDKLERPIEPVP
jgi:hypothetical protein